MEPHIFETHYHGEHKLHWSAESAVEEMVGWLSKINKEKLVSMVNNLGIAQSLDLGDLRDGEIVRVGYRASEIKLFYTILEE